MTIEKLDALFKTTIRIGFNHNIPEAYLYLATKDEANKLYDELERFFSNDTITLIIHMTKGLFISIMSLTDDNKIVTSNALQVGSDKEIIMFDKFMKETPNNAKILLGKGYIAQPSNSSQIISIKNSDFILRLTGYKVI